MYVLRVCSVVLVGLSASGYAQNLVDGSCVSSYDPSVDYFPDKIEQEYASFSVSYNNNYKIITGPSVGTIVAYQCGTPVPNGTELGADVVVSIPVQSIALLSTTQIPFVEFLGERLAITAVHGSTDAGELTVSSPCLRDLIEAGVTHNFPTANWNPVFDGLANDTDAIFCSAGWGCSAPAEAAARVGAALLPVGDASESTVFGAAEWLEYFAIFFNQEALAVAHVAEAEARYNTVAIAVAENAPAVGSRPKVMWAYYYYGWYAGSCPGTYYCAVVEDAGGEWLQLPDGAPNSWGGFDALTDDVFFAAAMEADVWLFPDDFEAKILAAGSGVNLTAVEALPCYANGRTFDITGNDGFGQSAKDWFESRMAEPDIFLADLAAAITPTAMPDHNRVWWRNVRGESPSPARICEDWTAPLSLWAEPNVCDLPYDGDQNGVVDIADLLGTLSMFNVHC